MKKQTSLIANSFFALMLITTLSMVIGGCARKSAGGLQGRSSRKENIFDSKYIREQMLKVTKWQLNNPKHQPTDWTNGAFYAGVVAAYHTTRSSVILDSLMALGQRTGWRPGRRYDHADDIAISQTYIDLYRLKNDPQMIRATIDTVQKMSTVPGPETKKGIIWWWCDALFMGPPTLVKLGVSLKDPSYFKINDSLFKQCYDLLYNQEAHLFARDASYLINASGEGKREANGQPIFWSRGNGWVMGGLVRILEELPSDYPTRPFYVQLYKEMAEKILSLQQADGLWRSSLLDPASYPGGEGSGTGFYCYALAWGINKGILDKGKYEGAVRKAWQGLNTLISPEGRVGWVQPIGADPKKNFNAESYEVYGAGAFLLAASEVIRLK
jgi:rhamnogalacturonyl hydrolase YesR